ncbi:Na+/H+ antiporter NhaC [Leptospira borgpetersenii]|uniref:Na+/H+ antiporter NhaC n=2 Tax=Leptospira borgpetersenii TaxID=174 RepID=A0A0E3B6L3_LEPBO|nr:Na+/H+ antiporter NhaC [Leptospira borgpetersenii]EMO10670.1 Na+/H+ antiporter NhaC [Leptospira borgpetersenii str. Noumea 25]MBF3373289.1 Na+/H+ antiporter NhaC [Leptospira borgpetersenii serovar Arborea]ALO26935.1 Na+/H+ antiporter NhaC [Leptospira borgpetersenii serovar Ballum]ANH01427.1 Na+/H+ antiporter NhaC [Leptospira borgpetersenii str. 4E]EKQ99318.1 Na+/H+ antiporter NhaC [Leptospira borgpetersenii serovar Castellonis str. 200801910]
MKTTEPEPGLFESFIPVIVLVMGLGYAGVVFGNGTVDGPAQMLLILSGTVASLLGIRLGVKWEFLEERILESLKNVLKPVLILLLIGSLIGVWVWSGIVPSMIVWGLKLLKPSLFLITACLLSSVVSLITGSSWSTVGTVGVALMGIGTTLDVPPGIAAGAVVSAAYFGDKLSPFSETTNLASSIAGTPLFTHIQHMLYTTLPAFCIAIIFFTWMGFDYSGSESGGQKVNEVIHLLERSFRIHPVLLFPPVLTFVLIYFKVPAIPSILAGILSGVLSGIFLQHSDLDFPEVYRQVLNAASKGNMANTENPLTDALLSRGGMASMLPTVWLIFSAMFFAGAMEGAGLIQEITKGILKYANTDRSLLIGTILTSISANLLSSDQYLSILVPGKMFKKSYEELGLDSKNLSRALEDSGTMTSALVPWNTCGSFMAAALGVPVVVFLPYAVLNLSSPFISLICAWTGWTIRKNQSDRIIP